MQQQRIICNYFAVIFTICSSSTAILGIYANKVFVMQMWSKKSILCVCMFMLIDKLAFYVLILCVCVCILFSPALHQNKNTLPSTGRWLLYILKNMYVCMYACSKLLHKFLRAIASDMQHNIEQIWHQNN